MSTKILEKIKVRKLFCIFEKYRKFQQLIFHKRKPGFRPPLSVRFRFAPSHCGLSPQPCQFDSAPLHLTAGFRPQPCQFDSAPLHLTAGFRPIQEDTDRWSCASTTSGPYLPVHGSMLIACFRRTWGCRRIRPGGLHLSECSLSSHRYCISHMRTYQSILYL